MYRHIKKLKMKTKYMNIVVIKTKNYSNKNTIILYIVQCALNKYIIYDYYKKCINNLYKI